MIRPCFKLIGCFLLPLSSWLLQTLSLVPLPTLGRSTLRNYGASLISAPLRFLLRQMEGGVSKGGRKKSWMRKMSEAKQRVKEEQE